MLATMPRAVEACVGAVAFTAAIASSRVESTRIVFIDGPKEHNESSLEKLTSSRVNVLPHILAGSCNHEESNQPVRRI